MGRVISLIGYLILLFFIIKAIKTWRDNGINVRDAIGIIPTKKTIVDVLVGLLIGLIVMIGIFLVEKKFSLITVEYIKGTNLTIFKSIVFVAYYALIEEILCRSFMLNGMIETFKNKYIAVLLTGVIFGILHASNPNATWISVISNGLGGVMYSIAYLGTKSLWLPFSLHFSWNFFQGPILGFPVSGMNRGGIVIQNYISDMNFFNGGGYGPEGGIICIGFRLVVIALVVLYIYYSYSKINNENQKNIG